MIDPWFALVLLIIVILAAFALLVIILVAFIAGFYMAERYFRGVAKSYEQLRDKYENLSQENTKLKDEVRKWKRFQPVGRLAVERGILARKKQLRPVHRFHHPYPVALRHVLDGSARRNVNVRVRQLVARRLALGVL